MPNRAGTEHVDVPQDLTDERSVARNARRCGRDPLPERVPRDDSAPRASVQGRVVATAEVAAVGRDGSNLRLLRIDRDAI
jgi:hypothetical protein